MRRLGHVLRGEETEAIRLVKKMHVDGMRGGVMAIDMRKMGVSGENAGDRIKCMCRIKVADPK